MPAFGQAISLDTKHILAWCKENNPKAYLAGKRYDKTQQPKGDPGGARIRHTLDRSGEDFKGVYRQRSATERVNSQAKALGIERPKPRNAASIRNLNTLTYVLINLHALQWVRQRQQMRNQTNTPSEGVGNPT